MAYRFKAILPRIPLEAEGVQLNFCKNTECQNYSVPATATYSKNDNAGLYHKGGGGSIRNPGLICNVCGQTSPLRSNQAVLEETKRLMGYLNPPEPTCPHEDCRNHAVPLSAGLAFYTLYGQTNAKTPRHKCMACKRVFSVKNSVTAWQRKPEKNEAVFRKLVNKGPFQRIFEEAETGGGALYNMIDFIHGQCRAFAGEIERRFLDGAIHLDRLYLSTDGQQYVVNWKVREDRRNIKLEAVGTADNNSGYVFAMNLNYIDGVDPVVLEAEAAPEKGIPVPFRKCAQYWLQEDYARAVARAEIRAKKSKRKRVKIPGTMIERIRAHAKEAIERENIEDPTALSSVLRLPLNGVQLKEDYVLFAHFALLKRLLADNVDKIRFCFDHDSGIRAACLATFVEEIMAERADAMYVSLAYGLTQPTKLAIKRAAKRRFKKTKAAHPGLTDREVETEMMLEEIRIRESDDLWGDFWVHHPLPDMGEPEKMMSIQTNIGNRFDERHLAHLLRKASLHGINRFFNVVRRRVMSLERQSGTASTQRREYSQYGSYNPAMIGKMLEILRVYYNYVLPVKEHHGLFIKKVDGRKTPAQYLGITNRTYTIREILEFVPQSKAKPAEAVSA